MTRLRLVPVMFERGARPHPPQKVYRAFLAQSEIFIGVYWRSYGWVAYLPFPAAARPDFRRS